MPSVLGELCKGGGVFRGVFGYGKPSENEVVARHERSFSGTAVPGGRTVTFWALARLLDEARVGRQSSLGWGRCPAVR